MPKPGMVLIADKGAMSPSAAIRTDANAQPVRAYVKTILRLGKVYASTGEFVITPAYLDQVVKTFAAMKAAGVKVPVQVGHNMDADQTRGYVTDVFREGDRLVASVEMIGADALALASRSEVSVYIDPEYAVDGNTYTDALVHLACVPDPAVKKLGPFVPLAASLGGKAKQVLVFSATRSSTMDWRELATIMGLDMTGLDDTTGPARVKAALTDMTCSAAKASQAAAALSASKAETTAAKTEAETVKSELVSLKASRGLPTIDQDDLEERADTVASEIGSLVASGQINAAQKIALDKLILGEKGKRPVLALSRKAATHAGLEAPIARQVIDILKLSAPRKVGEKTGAQIATDEDKAMFDSFKKQVGTLSR